MSVNNLRSIELGFAEFTSLLITDTLNAVIGTMLEQEKTVADLAQSVYLPPSQFAQLYISPDSLRAEILKLFPEPETNDKSTIDPGSVYFKKTELQKECPAIEELTGYRIVKGDVEKNSQGTIVISGQGYENISLVLLEKLARSRQECLRSIIAKGIPRVLIDHGRVSAKLTIKLVEENAAKGSPVQKRIMVQPVNARGPEFLTLKTDITSEVDITFKTVIP